MNWLSRLFNSAAEPPIVPAIADLTLVEALDNDNKNNAGKDLQFFYLNAVSLAELLKIAEVAQGRRDDEEYRTAICRHCERPAGVTLIKRVPVRPQPLADTAPTVKVTHDPPELESWAMDGEKTVTLVAVDKKGNKSKPVTVKIDAKGRMKTVAPTGAKPPYKRPKPRKRKK
jgi:hypothetical protein